MSNPIELFKTDDDQVRLHVSLDGETVWLSQLQMGQLFDTTPENVLMHLQNIYKDEELDNQATTKEFLVVRQEGKRQVRRSIKHYNLDAIISVGYRVSSKRATQFRKWATQILNQYLVEGYPLNEKPDSTIQKPSLSCRGFDSGANLLANWRAYFGGFIRLFQFGTQCVPN